MTAICLTHTGYKEVIHSPADNISFGQETRYFAFRRRVPVSEQVEGRTARACDP